MAYARGLACIAILGGSIAGVVGAANGCSIYDSSLLLPAIEAGADSASEDAGVDSAGDDGGCNPLHPPARPTTEDGTKDLDFVLAIHKIDFGASLDAGSQLNIGYDLDNLCTCPGASSCKTNDSKEMHCDGDRGIDNSGGQLLSQFALLSGGALSQTGLNSNINDGIYGLLLHVEHYNGGMNDKQVVVSIYVSDGMPPPPDGGTQMRPNWDGNDSWTIDSASVLGGADAGRVIPNFADTMAYVANGKLVASADFPLTLGSNGLVTLEFAGGFVTATLVAQGSTFKVTDGLLAGRWPTKKLLGSLQQLNLSGVGALCQGTQAYQNIKTKVCAAADIPAEIPGNPMSACNALSMGIQFTAEPAKLGPVVARTPGAPLCPDAGPDDCN